MERGWVGKREGLSASRKKCETEGGKGRETNKERSWW